MQRTKWAHKPGTGSGHWQKFHMEMIQWQDCITAAAGVINGDIDGSLAQLRDNGLWGVEPWPDQELRAAAGVHTTAMALAKAFTDILKITNPTN